MKLIKLFSVILAFCILPVALANTKSIDDVLRAVKEAKKSVKDGEKYPDESGEKKKKKKRNIDEDTEDANNVSLTVSASAKTKEEAIKIALNDAIRQAYGAFVSSNMEIIDDEIVKDEIVTIAHGNIKRYEEISSAILSNGDFYVTLKALVSISNLVKYAESKGAEVEFAGAAFGMEIKMLNLNKENEAIAIRHMIQSLEKIPNLFDLNLEIGEPRVGSDSGTLANYYIIEGTVYASYNENTKTFFDVLYSTLMSLSMSEEEWVKYGKFGLKYSHQRQGFYLRNTDFYWNKWLENYIKDYIENNIIIADNLSSPTELWSGRLYNNEHTDKTDREVFGKVFRYNSNTKFFQPQRYEFKLKMNSRMYNFHFSLYIPIKDISKYSSFRALYGRKKFQEEEESKFHEEEDVAEPETVSVQEGPVVIIPEKQPEFPGGQAALTEFLAQNIQYPKIAVQNGVQGRVQLQFVVNTDGSLSDIVVARGVDPYLDKEAIRVVQSMPKWTPETQRGKTVRVRYTLPVAFRL